MFQCINDFVYWLAIFIKSILFCNLEVQGECKCWSEWILSVHGSLYHYDVTSCVSSLVSQFDSNQENVQWHWGISVDPLFQPWVPCVWYCWAYLFSAVRITVCLLRCSPDMLGTYPDSSVGCWFRIYSTSNCCCFCLSSCRTQFRAAEWLASFFFAISWLIFAFWFQHGSKF